MSSVGTTSATEWPPGPPDSAWAQAQAWIEHPVEFWEDCHRRYGDTFTVDLGSVGKVVVFCHPEAVREVFRLPADAFEVHQYNEHYKHVMGARSLLVSDGQDHKRKRRLLLPSLGHRALESEIPSIAELSHRVADSWAPGNPFAPLPGLHVLALMSMLRLCFGTDHEFSRTLLRWFTAGSRQAHGAWSPWTQFEHYQPQLRALMSKHIESLRADSGSEARGLFDGLVRAKNESGASLEDEEIHDHIFTLLIAGVDTTALALAWTVHWLAENPHVQERARAEVHTAVSGASPGAVLELPYLTAVCQESLRIYPVVTTPSGRRLTRAVEIAGLVLPAGVTLLPCTYLIHHRPELYPEPERFQPERFLERSFGPHEYLPFGGGGRMCIGSALAMMEMKLTTAALLERWVIRPASGRVRPVRHGTLLAPDASFSIEVVPVDSLPASDLEREHPFAEEAAAPHGNLDAG